MDRDYQQSESARRPTALDLWAAGLLLATVILHVVAMFPHYFGGPAGEGSAWSQPDQAAMYAVLTAGWALALGLVLAGPARARLGAGVAVGVAATELGFRVTDVGEVLHYGGAQSSVGLWIMTAAWLVGAAGALLAVLAVRRRSRAENPVVAAQPIGPWIPTTIVDVPASESSVASWSPDFDPGWAAEWGPQAEPGVAGLAGRAGLTAGSSRADSTADWRWPGEPGVTGVGAAEPTQTAPGEPPLAPAGEPVPPNVPVTTPTGWAAPRPVPPVPVQSAGPVPYSTANLPAPAETTAALPVEATAALPVEATAALPVEATAALPVEATDALPVGATSALTVGSARVEPRRSAHLGPYGVGPTMVVALLALATAGAFLPAWDHYVGVVAASGRSISFSLGNAFSGPWPIVLGNMITALALTAIPIAVTRLRDRTIAAAVVVGSLVVLAAQFTSAIVQVDQTVPPSVVGLTPAQQAQLGLQLHLSLTGWFTFDVLAAYALFVAVMVIGYLRPVEAPASAAGAWPATPDGRRAAGVPWS